MEKTNRITDEDEKTVFIEFQKQQLLRTQSSEVVMGTIFHVGNWAYIPLMDFIDTGKLNHIPILFMYGNGEEDWMWRNVPQCHDTVNASEPLEKSYLETILEKGNSKLN